MRYILKKIIRKLYHLISFLTLMLIFIPSVKANDSYGGSINTDISTPFRLMDFDIYGSYNVPAINSAYFYSDDFCAGPSWENTRVYSIETQESYAGGNLYSITIYLYNSDRTIRIVPAPSGSEQRRIGLGNSTNQARTNWVGSTSSAVPVTYTNYSYDYFDVKLVNGTVFSGVYSVTYFFVPNQDNIAVAVPFGTNTYKCGTYYFAGYKLMNLGPANNLSSSDIQSIINSSGLATASSQNEIKTSLNQVKQEVTELNNSIDNVNDSITSEDEPTIDLSDVDTISTTPISDLVTLPASLLNSYLSAFSGTCSSYTLPLPFDHSITLPCFTISDYVGNSVANIIDMAICLFMAYEIVLLFIRIFDDITTLSDTYTNWVKRGRY